MPWLLMYGVSSFIVIHRSWFETEARPELEPVFERTYSRPVDASAELRAVALEILKDCDLEGAFWVNRPNADTLHIDRFSFWGNTRLTYSIKDQKLKAEHQRMVASQAVVRMHFRGGYGQPTFLDKFWGLLVDIACVGIILWVFSGLIMWWRLTRLRSWGAIALVCGVLSFGLLVWRL
jgi:hypothetical protein